jgi:hypothetical protein
LKFSEIERSDWEGLKPYLDTCLLPVTGLSGFEQPWEATQELEYLRDVMDCVEGPYKGRIVTYPAFHYVEGPAAAAAVNSVCQKIKGAGFRYVIVISGHPSVASIAFPDADLLLCPESAEGDVMSGEQFKVRVARDIRAMWQPEAAQNG